MSDRRGLVARALVALRGINWFGFGAAAVFVVAVSCLPLVPHQANAPQSRAAQSNQRTAYEQPSANNGNRITEIPTSVINYVRTQYGEPYSNYCARDAGQKDHEWLHQFACDVRITDVVIAGFTIILALFTIILALVGIWQALITRRSFRRQLRAYVFVELAERIGPHGAALEYYVSIKNSGQTPAYRVRHVSKAQFRDIPPEVPLTPATGSPDDFEHALGPQGITTLNNKLENDDVLTAPQMAKITAGTGGLYIVGDIGYRDAFGKKRRTRYRYIYSKDAQANGRFVYCSDGNDAD